MNQIAPFLPLSFALFSGLSILLLEVFLTPNQKRHLHMVAMLGAGLTAGSALYLFTLLAANENQQLVVLERFFVIDHFSIFFYLLLILTTLVILMTSAPYLEQEKMVKGEYYALIFFALSGMLILASSLDLMTLFIGMEIMSMAVYVLVGYRRENLKANEGAFKYFLLGGLASAIFLYGIAMIYGSTGTTHLPTIREYYLTHANYGLSSVGLLFILGGLAFKVGAVPFHTWSPDAYEGAPMPVTSFMATAVKAAAFALLLRILGEGFIGLRAYWIELVALLAAATMLVGNILAFIQSNIKRMLAYSSIVHTGYLLVGVSALTQSRSSEMLSAILYYLFIYVISSLGVFAALSYMSSQNERFTQIDDFAGLAQKHPLVAASLALFMFSFIGVPPLGGFFAKYYLFASALSNQQVLLVFFAILNSILAVSYYLRVIAVMYMKPAAHERGLEPRPVATVLILSLTTITVFWAGFGPFDLLGIFPGLNSLVTWVQLASLF